MDTNFLENNYITLVGKVTGEKRLSHEIYGERFYIFDLEIPRLSGNSDIIPVTISERIITDEMLTQGKKLLVKGQFRSYNSYENEKNKLILTVFAKDIIEVNEEEKSALVVVPDYQLSLAIGKEGQNARLAAKLTNWKIDIKSESQAKQDQE